MLSEAEILAIEHRKRLHYCIKHGYGKDPEHPPCNYSTVRSPLDAQVDCLLAHIREQQKKIATLRTANQDILDAEHDLSDAYLRLRYIIGPAAFNTPHAPAAEQVWETTENALCALLRELRQLNQDACETEDRCRRLLAVYDKSSPNGVVPLDEVIEVALRKEPAPFADSNQRIREIVEDF